MLHAQLVMCERSVRGSAEETHELLRRHFRCMRGGEATLRIHDVFWHRSDMFSLQFLRATGVGVRGKHSLKHIWLRRRAQPCGKYEEKNSGAGLQRKQTVCRQLANQTDSAADSHHSQTHGGGENVFPSFPNKLSPLTVAAVRPDLFRSLLR